MLFHWSVGDSSNLAPHRYKTLFLQTSTLNDLVIDLAFFQPKHDIGLGGLNYPIELIDGRTSGISHDGHEYL